MRTNIAVLVVFAVFACMGGSRATRGADPAAGGKPPVPGVGQGVYLGAWVNPAGAPGVGVPGSKEFRQVPLFEQQVGRKLAILHLYTAWNKPAPIQSLNVISGRFGAIPLLDWACGDQDKNISQGNDDELIYDYAKALRDFGRPIFLRWFWEMNLDHPSCAGSASDYVAAWRRIWGIFHGQIPVNGKTIEAENVAFVWCPSVSRDWEAFYPDNGYVDWIAVDGYSRGDRGNPSFSQLFGSFYDWADGQDPGAPVMIAETGSGNAASGTAKGQIQAAYLASAEQAIDGQGATMPAVEAFVYFDAVGQAGSWDLTGAGLDAFRAVGEQFTFEEPRP